MLDALLAVLLLLFVVALVVQHFRNLPR